MGSLDTIKRGNFSMRGFLADVRQEDPRRCWPFQSIIDYHEFRQISESTPAPSEIERNQEGPVVESENPAAPNVQRKRSREGNESGSENSTDSDDDIPLAELLRRSKALKVPAPDTALAPASSSDGLELLSSVAMTWESGPRVDRAREARVQAAEKPQPDGSSSGIQPLGSVSRMHEPVIGDGGARVQAPEMAPTRPREHEVIVCRLSRNPAEFSTEHAKLFLRTL